MAGLGTISGAALNQYLVSARAQSTDPTAALTHAGIPESAVDDPDRRIAGERFEIMLEGLVQACDDPLFGLHTSEFVQPGSYNVMGYMAMSAATIGDALARVRQYEQLVGDMGTTETRLDGEQVRVIWHCRHEREPVRRHLIDNVLASWVRYTRWLAGDSALTPDAVRLAHARPDTAADRREYERVFGCPVHFNQPESALVSPVSLLHHPLRQPDSRLLATLETHARHQLEALGMDTSIKGRVRAHLNATLSERAPGKELVAAQLGLNPRTLHRRLRAEGTSWQAILDALRLEQAQRLLHETNLPQAQIAHRLGYTDVRSFQRNFQRQSGETPGRYRQRLT